MAPVMWKYAACTAALFSSLALARPAEQQAVEDAGTIPDQSSQDNSTASDQTKQDIFRLTYQWHKLTESQSGNNGKGTDGSKVSNNLKLPVKSYVALGDSFTANPTEYQKLPDPENGFNCYRTTASWANKMAADPEIMTQPKDPGSKARKRAMDVASYNPPTPPSFDMMACTGYTSVDMLQKQISGEDGDFNAEADLYTITVGGNDLDFGQIVKTCVYNLDPSIASALYSMFGGDNCEGMLEKASKLLDEGSDFAKNLDALLQNLDVKITNREATVAVVPYMQFYNIDTIRFGMDEGEAGKGDHETADSTCRTPLARRQKFFELTNKLNTFLKGIAEKYGFIFVDDGPLQAGFDGHRFCEPLPAAGGEAAEVWINDSMLEQLMKKDCVPAADENINAECASEAKEWDNNVANTVFHPNYPGTSVYKDTVKNALKKIASSALAGTV
ncbi:MAG: hypothetical protein M1831_004594 [Alyxoria varia]|nr:MAG: hypothetical protein M1831_004594 [Alyxoria varia]